MTGRYTHIFEESKREAIKKLFIEETGQVPDKMQTDEEQKLQHLADKLASLPPGVVDMLLKAVER